MGNKSKSYSKTKLGAFLVGLSAVLGTIGSWLGGVIDTSSALQALILEVGVVLVIFGIRDMPLINN